MKLACPRCNGTNFYFEDGDKLIFFSVEEDYEITFKKKEQKFYEEKVKNEKISCVSCSWKGYLRNLD